MGDKKKETQRRKNGVERGIEVGLCCHQSSLTRWGHQGALTHPSQRRLEGRGREAGEQESGNGTCKARRQEGGLFKKLQTVPNVGVLGVRGQPMAATPPGPRLKSIAGLSEGNCGARAPPLGRLHGAKTKSERWGTSSWVRGSSPALSVCWRGGMGALPPPTGPSLGGLPGYGMELRALDPWVPG